MQPIEIIVYGDPQAQKRHRTFRMNSGGDRFGNMHVDPSKAKKNDLLWVIQEMRPEKPLDFAIRVDAVFFFKRPKSHYRTGKNSHILRDDAPYWHIGKPDRDNLDKFILDAMKGVFWKDDSIVCDGNISKKYDENPRTWILITKL